MKKYYFVYRPTKTTRGLPYPNGYTQVIANNICDASELFRLVHPDIVSGRLNCTYALSEEEFNAKDSNAHLICHEVISISVNKTVGVL